MSENALVPHNGTQQLMIPMSEGQGVTLPQAQQLAEQLSGSVMLPKHMQEPSNILAGMLLSAQLRVPFFAVANGTHMIQGRLTIGAQLMLAAITASGTLEQWEEVERTSERCVIRFKRRGFRVKEHAWSTDDAKRAGLLGKDIWKSYPANMLWNRCTSDIARMQWSDVLAGAYTPDDLGPGWDGGTGQEYAGDEVVEEEPKDKPNPQDDSGVVADLKAMYAGVLEEQNPAEALDLLAAAKASVLAALKSGQVVQKGQGHADLVEAHKVAEAHVNMLNADLDNEGSPSETGSETVGAGAEGE